MTWQIVKNKTNRIYQREIVFFYSFWKQDERKSMHAYTLIDTNFYYRWQIKRVNEARE